MEKSRSIGRARSRFAGLLVAVCALLSGLAQAQVLPGELIGTVRDQEGGVIVGALARLSSDALLGGPLSLTTSKEGRFRFAPLPPGTYTLDVEQPGFTPFHEAGIVIGAGATIARAPVLKIAGIASSVVVEERGTRLDARNVGFVTRFSLGDLDGIPMRRASMFGALRAAPGISPTSPASGTVTTISAFGSNTNENQFLSDGTNTTCPCNGVARSEPGIGFIQEIHVQSIGASAEYGNFLGAVVNVVMKQGSERWLADATYYAQTIGLTSQPVQLAAASFPGGPSGYHRATYRDLTANIGGPVVHNRLWVFGGYQYLRDHDSQPGTDPTFPRTYDQDKVFAKLTWRLSPRLQLVQSFHGEYGLNPDRPTIVTPYAAASRPRISVPAFTFGHLTHSLSPNTVWDVRAGRFRFAQVDELPVGSVPPSRFDRATGITSGAPSQFNDVTIIRTTAKATLSHYQPSWLGGDHLWKVGVQFERGEHHSIVRIPGGVRFNDINGQPSDRVTSPPQNVGGAALTASVFATDGFTIADRFTFDVGVRFDRAEAFSQDLPALDGDARETSSLIEGHHTMYVWNILSPRLGFVMRLTHDGRAMLRASFGRYSPGVLTGELQPFHPGAAAVTTRSFVAATGDYTGTPRVVDPKLNLIYDTDTRAPRTDEFSLGVDREIGPMLTVTAVYVHKTGANFIGWQDIAGEYVDTTRTLEDGRVLPVKELNTAVTPANARKFELTNQDDFSLKYNGLVLVAEKRWSQHWQAFGSYTFSRAEGLLPSSGTSAAGAQVGTVSPPQPSLFGRDPNDWTNVYGRLANDRPHMFRAMGSLDLPRTGAILALNVQHFSGKPWAESTLVSLRQGEVRVLIEPRGTRRLSSQTLLDLRLSRVFRAGAANRVELILDVLNVLNDTAEEAIASDVRFPQTPALGQPTVFMDPRRAMLSVRLNLGK